MTIIINSEYILSDNKRTNNVVVNTNSTATKLSQLNGNTGAPNLSQLDYSSKGTAKAVSNVLAHYAGEKGISGYTGVYSGSKGSALTNPNGNRSEERRVGKECRSRG